VEAALSGGGAVREDVELLERLRERDESAFLELVDRHSASMLRVARAHVGSVAVAEEVVQEAWIGVLKGLDGFEGRSSLKSWIFTIVVFCARHRGGLEHRSVPFSSLATAEAESGDPSVSPDRFLDADHPRWPGHWSDPPEAWADDQIARHETVAAARAAIEALPPAQRQVITLRDVEGLESAEVCAALGISEGNQRVLLHRARSKVRASLEATLGAAAAHS
jgi:RNA polymerase sigma-70 factor (ECF subfamily)